jgi:hypothetical protein
MTVQGAKCHSMLMISHQVLLVNNLVKVLVNILVNTLVNFWSVQHTSTDIAALTVPPQRDRSVSNTLYI